MLKPRRRRSRLVSCVSLLNNATLVYTWRTPTFEICERCFFVCRGHKRESFEVTGDFQKTSNLPHGCFPPNLQIMFIFYSVYFLFVLECTTMVAKRPSSAFLCLRHQKETFIQCILSLCVSTTTVVATRTTQMIQKKHLSTILPRAFHSSRMWLSASSRLNFAAMKRRWAKISLRCVLSANNKGSCQRRNHVASRDQHTSVISLSRDPCVQRSIWFKSQYRKRASYSEE